MGAVTAGRDLQARAIERQNVQLEAANTELRAHEDEILRKNEELERGRSEVAAASSRKTQMLASISHDIRSSIQPITLMAEAIARAAERPEQIATIGPLARRLQANALSVTHFLSEVIDLASFDSGRYKVDVSDFALRDLVELQCERVRPIAESKGLDLAAKAWDFELRTDRVKLGRVIGNLLSNAVKFTVSGAVIVACGLDTDENVFIRVSDTGCGIAPHDLEQIFEEFAQLGHGSRETGIGWGLGLAISRRMVHLLGGSIDVKSAPGAGTEFTVRLPPSSLVANAPRAATCFLGRATSA